ncbi:MAG: tetratricopeptide repeat protein [Verrucomicrobiales bacterium]|nr:tetratricopeptide repeat protein [Verrucomicrobiales bacterium]
MLTPEQLAAYFENRLEPVERAEAERELAGDAAAQCTLADQLNLDLALRVLLGRPEGHERVKASIFTVLRGAPEASLAAGILRDAGGASGRPPQPGFADPDLLTPAPYGSRALAAGGAWRRHVGHAWRRLLDSPWRWGLASVAALVAVVWTLVGLFPTRPAAGPEIGQFSAVVGEPTVSAGAKRAALPAQASATVHLGDRIDTGDADRVEIQFLDGTTLRLAFNTSVELPLSVHTQMPDTNILLRPPEIRLLKGQVWTKVAKLTNAPAYAIRTDAATAVARGTEFGVQLQRLDRASTNAQSPVRHSPFAAVLTVKEGAVDFFNAFGSVQATAMTESTARADSAPTEPRRIDTLQTVELSTGATWALLSSPLDWPEAATKLAGGGTVGWRLRELHGTRGAPEVRIAQLAFTSLAGRAGLRVGDILTAFEDRPLTNAHDLATAVLLRPGATLALRVRRPTGEEPIALVVAKETNLLRGPDLSTANRTALAGLLRQWLAEPVNPAPDATAESHRFDQAAAQSRLPAVRAAAFNQLGVAYELADAFGPAIRAYGRACYLEPDVPLYRFNLALALRQIGSFERASEELREVLRLEPDAVPARKRLAEVTSMLGRHEEALRLAEALLRTAPDDHGTWELQAQLFLKLQRPTDAVAPARRAAELDPACPIAHSYLAQALHDAGRLPEAEAAWTEALERAPFEPAFHLNLGALQRDLGQVAKAAQSFRRAIELRPDFALAYRNLGEALTDQRDDDGAFAAFAKARELDAADPTASIREGDLALRRRQFPRAERAYRGALDIAPHQADAWYSLGEACRFQRRPADAERAYRQAIELQPAHAAAHTALGIVHFDRGNATEAERLYRRAIELNPREAAPYHNLGNLYREARGDLDAAERWFRQALERSPENGESLGGLGLVASGRGDLAEAERQLRRAIERAPESSALHNNLGEILRQRGRPNEAEPLYRKALELDPDNPSPYGNLGILQAERKQFAEAEKTFRALLERSSGNARLPALVNLATVCGQQNKTAEAERFFRQALDLAPGHPRVKASFASFLADHRLKLDEALSFAQDAVQAGPENPEFLDALGWVQAQRGDLATAEHTLLRALELAGEASPAEDILRHLGIVRGRKEASTR